MAKNLIIISIDNLRADCIASNPDKRLLNKYKLKQKLKTPNLDWFAKNGKFYNKCISVAPYTTPAHASILTGQWPYSHGIKSLFGEKLKKPTILAILKKHNYSTLFQTDFPFLLGPLSGFSKGVDKYVKGDDCKSIEWLKKNKKKKVACFFHFANVHIPYGYSNLRSGGDDYKQKVKELLGKYHLKPIEGREEIYSFPYTFYEAGKEDQLLLWNYNYAIHTMYQLGLYGEIMDLYVEGINYFEKNRFTNFIKNLKSLGFLKNSLIVITGDHGETWSKKQRSHFGWDNIEDPLSDENIIVPLIFYGQDLRKGTSRGQVRSVDIVPTIISLLKIKSKFKFDGCSILDASLGKSDLAAFSQAWLSKEHVKELDFLKEAIQSGKIPKDKFDHLLIGSSLRTGRLKITNHYGKNGKLSDRVMVNFMNKQDGILDIDGYVKLLEEYDRKSHRSESKIKKLKGEKIFEIKRQLNSLGYKV